MKLCEHLENCLIGFDMYEFKDGDKVKLIAEIDWHPHALYPRPIVGEIYTVVDYGRNAMVKIGYGPYINHRSYHNCFKLIKALNLPEWF